MWNRVELKLRGKSAFQKNFMPCVGAAFLMYIITMLTGTGSAGSGRPSMSRTITEHNGMWSHTETYSYGLPFVGALFGAIGLAFACAGVLLGIFVGNVLQVGGKRYFVLNQTENVPVGTVLSGFKSGHYGNIVLTMFLRSLYIFLWSLLLVIPGIIKHYEYLMVPYILSENPGMDQKQAFLISKKMMTGQKMDAFIMDFSFIGWWLFSVITCGLGSIFYVNPYYEASFSEMCTFNKGKAFHEGYIR